MSCVLEEEKTTTLMQDPIKKVDRFVSSLIGFVPISIGILVIWFVWNFPEDEGVIAPSIQTPGNQGPPLFVKLFFSIVASVFVLAGIKAILRSFGAESSSPDRHDGVEKSLSDDDENENGKRPNQNPYACDNCGATLRPNADVSPSGDVKCSYCNTWFNIHK